MKGMSFTDEFTQLIKSGRCLLWVLTHESERALRDIRHVTEQVIGIEMYRWRWTTGLLKYRSGVPKGELIPETEDIGIAVSKISAMTAEGVFVIDNAHWFFEANPLLAQTIIDALPMLRARGQYIVILSSRLSIPAELEKEVRVVDYRLPDRETLETVLNAQIESAEHVQGNKTAITDRRALIDAAIGLTTSEAADAYALALVRHGNRLNGDAVKTVQIEKAAIVKKSGLLEYFEPQADLASVGGYWNLKTWLGQRSKGFSEKAAKYGLQPPRGLLLVGPPGTGKSLTAKAIAATWRLPLLKFDLGRLFGSLVGQSEENVRKAVAVAEAMAPCVLWIDELEKGLAGMSSSGQTDSGVTSRVFGALLTWLTEKTSPVFVVATANDVTSIRPEFLRKGRFDEIFVIDLPTLEEREEIFSIHLSKVGRKPSAFDVKRLAQAAHGYGGAEIEEAVRAGMWIAYGGDREVTTDDIITAISQTRPLSETMADQVEAVRSWAEGRARSASGQPTSVAAVENGAKRRLRK